MNITSDILRNELIDFIDRKTQAYFELGMSDESSWQPIILYSSGISNRDIKEILNFKNKLKYYQKKLYPDFPRPYSVTSIDKMGIRPIDPGLCFDYKYICYWSFKESLTTYLQARIFYIVSETELSDGHLMAFAARISRSNILF